MGVTSISNIDESTNVSPFWRQHVSVVSRLAVGAFV